MPGTLYVVATPIGNLEDITLRALRILGEVALIAAEDTRRTAKLLAHYRIRTPTTSLHEHNERQKLNAILGRLEKGESVALVSDAGTPAVSDPGQQLIRSAIERNIRVEPIPGSSAILTALVASGLSTDMFLFLGFPPNRSKARKRWFSEVADHPQTLVIFEAPHRIKETLWDALEILGDRKACLGRELTKAHEEFVRQPISAILADAKDPRGEYCLVIAGKLHGSLDRNITTPTRAELYDEFGQMTEHQGLSRRGAITALARRHRLSTRDVYQSVEAEKAIRDAAGTRP